MIPASPAAADKAGPFENTNVFGNGVEGHGIGTRDFRDARLTMGQTLEDGAAGRIGQSDPGKLGDR